MPFPPNFDHAWDITQPPDTQLANLLGQDIRNLKDDIMQRMSLLSGTIGNRPTPEILNATWGGAGFGLLYFATDTSQIFQWNGAAWVDVSSSFVGSPVLNSQGNAAAIVGNSAPQTLFTYNLQANVVSNLRGLRITVGANHSAGGASVTYALTLNGVNIANVISSAGGGVSERVTILNTGAASGAVTGLTMSSITSFGAIAQTVAGLAWANLQALTFTFNAPNTDSVTPILWLVELV